MRSAEFSSMRTWFFASLAAVAFLAALYGYAMQKSTADFQTASRLADSPGLAATPSSPPSTTGQATR
jgi:hypothetical protein